MPYSLARHSPRPQLSPRGVAIRYSEQRHVDVIKRAIIYQKHEDSQSTDNSHSNNPAYID